LNHIITFRLRALKILQIDQKNESISHYTGGLGKSDRARKTKLPGQNLGLRREGGRV